MPKAKRVPGYRHFKLRKLACVTLDGVTYYLGPYGSPESHDKYQEKITEWRRRGRVTEADQNNPDGYTCGQLALDYLEFATSYYVKNGRPTSQIWQIKLALRELVKLYETEPASRFGPVKLKNLQQYLVDQAKSRTYVNKLVDCLKLAFKWAASEELIPASTYDALRTVGGLKKGRCTARETDPVEPVDEATVNETLEHLSPVVADMVRVQLRSAMRPGEVVTLRPRDVTFGRDGVWSYRPETHKTEHHDQDRVIAIGPQAQEVLAPYLEGRDPDACCFSPAESQRQHFEARRRNRKSPLTPSQKARTRKAKPSRAPREQFTVASYRRAIKRACELAFAMPDSLRYPPLDVDGKRLPETAEQRKQRKREAAAWRKAHCWFPNQLRHTQGTLIRHEHGLEAAQAVLGHRHADTTEIYAERNRAKASEVMKQIG